MLKFRIKTKSKVLDIQYILKRHFSFSRCLLNIKFEKCRSRVTVLIVLNRSNKVKRGSHIFKIILKIITLLMRLVFIDFHPF